MKLLELLLEFSMIKDIPEWCLCPWWQFWLSPCALRKLCLKIGWNLLSLKASRTISKIDDITWVVADDNGHSWLGLVSLMTFWIVSICPEEAMFEIWFKSVECKGIKNPFKDWWHAGVVAGVYDDNGHSYWGWYSWWCFGLSPYALRKLCLIFFVKICWVWRHQESFQRLMTLLELLFEFIMVHDDNGYSWLGLVSLMIFWIISICSEEVLNV